MEAILDDYVSNDDLKSFETVYNQHIRDGTVTTSQQFEYAWCLIRSRYPADIKRGIALMEDLFIRGDETAKRDYLYYLAIGNAKLKDYDQALKLVKKFLNVEPANRQAQELLKVIKQRVKREGLMGMAIIGGAAVAIGGLVGLGIALSKK